MTDATPEGERTRLGKILLDAAGLETTRLETFLRSLTADDPDLAEEVRRRVCVSELLPRSFLAAPAAERLQASANKVPGTVEDPPNKVPGTSLEPTPISERYALGSCLGEGGMARVFEAFDHKLSRSLALKFLTRDEPEIVAHFLREARAQAQVRHRHVLEVYDTGRLEGRPFIAMRLVRGGTLSELQEELPLEQRVRLLMQAAEGLHAAHTEGVIHRDIKPSNILVEEEDGGLHAYLADFGIAGEARAPGGQEQLVAGTLAFMAPELLRQPAAAVDRRSDVYSLGATMYAVFTGRLPHGSGDPVALVQRILHRDPLPPREHVPSLPVELEAIVLRCLERTPDRRYSSARAVAEDLRRYLEGELVEAYTASLAYRLTRFVLRHRLLAIAAGVASLTLVLASILVTLFAVRADRERQRAEQRSVQAEKLIDFMVVDLRKKLAQVERLEVLDEVDEAAMQYFAAVPASELSDEELARRSRSLYHIGDVRIQKGDLEEAQEPLEESLRLARSLSERDPENRERLFELGQSYFWLGYVHYERGESVQALAAFEPYLHIAQTLTSLNPDNHSWRLELAYAHSNLGSTYKALGRFEDALAHFLETLTIDKELAASEPGNRELQASLAGTYNALGELLEKLGRLEEARRHFEADLAIKRTLVLEEPENHRWRASLTISLDFLASQLLFEGKIRRAEDLLLEAEAQNQLLVERDPDNAMWEMKLAWNHYRLGEVALAKGSLESAAKRLSKAEDILGRGAESNASLRKWQYNLAITLCTLALLRAEHDPTLALSYLERSRDILQGVRESYSQRLWRARGHLLEGRIVQDLGDEQGAAEAWREAEELLRPLSVGSRDGQVLVSWAELALHTQRPAEARKALQILHDQGIKGPGVQWICREWTCEALFDTPGQEG